MSGRALVLALLLPGLAAAQAPDGGAPDAGPPDAAPAPVEEVPEGETVVEIPEDEPAGPPGAVVTDEVKVQTSILREASPEDVFEHAGGRTVLDREAIDRTGANALPDVMRRIPGVKVVEATGTGNTDTKLNIGVRGLDPRLTGRSTVLLDEIPIAVAPYGQPQASLFPVSLFSIDKIDVVRGGAATRYGPQTVGGVINLSTREVPKRFEARLATQADHWGDYLAGIGAGDTWGPAGLYAEYSFRGGGGYREHSDREVHAAIFKGGLRLGAQTELTTLVHVYEEESELPGGLFPDAYAEDPFQSLRPDDRFLGSRQGVSLKLAQGLGDLFRLELISFYNRSSREFRLADEPEPLATVVQDIPRRYDVIGVEPRLGARLTFGETLLELNTGYRLVFEEAHQERIERDLRSGLRSTSQDDDNQLAAHAVYAQGDLWLLEQTVRLSAGTRFESVRLRRRNNLDQTILENDYQVILPGFSAWYQPLEALSVFASYGRSFGSPQYLQIGLAQSRRQLTAEIADTAEIGAKVLEWSGFTAGVTGFYMNFHDQIEFDETSFENVGRSIHQGVETEAALELGELVDALDGFEVEAGYTFTHAETVEGPYEGKTVPYAPEHSVWAEIGYETRLFHAADNFRIAVDGWWESTQHTDRRNTPVPDARGSVGPIDDVFIANANVQYGYPLADSVALEVRGGVRNLFDTRYFDRTDDRNAGMLLSRPLTAWGGLNLKWVPAGLAE